MPTSITVTGVTHGQDGSKQITLQDGSGIPLADLTAAQDFANSIGAVDALKWLVVSRYLAHSPTLADDSSIEGKTFTLNLLDNTAVVEITG